MIVAQVPLHGEDAMERGVFIVLRADRLGEVGGLRGVPAFTADLAILGLTGRGDATAAAAALAAVTSRKGKAVKFTQHKMHNCILSKYRLSKYWYTV